MSITLILTLIEKAVSFLFVMLWYAITIAIICASASCFMYMKNGKVVYILKIFCSIKRGDRFRTNPENSGVVSYETTLMVHDVQ